MSKEIWKTKPEWEGYYEFSNYGVCRSVDRYIIDKNGHKRFCKGRILKPFSNGNLILCKNGIEYNLNLGKTIAELFMDNYTEDTPLVYKDGDRNNCNLNNLQVAELYIQDIDGNWKDVIGFEGLYQVSDDGRVRSLPRLKICGFNGKQSVQKGRILKPGHTNDGYAFVNLVKDGKSKPHYIHRLVAQAFLSNPNNYPVVNHKDENPSNNYYKNLEWCTQQYNINYGTAKERIVKTKRANNPSIYNTPVTNITTGEQFNSISEACDFYGFSNRQRDLIKRCCEGEYSTVAGYNWKYTHDKDYKPAKHKFIICIETGEEYKSAAKLAKDIEVTPTAVSNHMNGQLAHLKGLHYAYKEAGKEYTISPIKPKRNGYIPKFPNKYKPHENKVQCNLSITPQDKQLYKKLAKEAGMPLQDFLAQVLNETLTTE